MEKSTFSMYYRLLQAVSMFACNLSFNYLGVPCSDFRMRKINIKESEKNKNFNKIMEMIPAEIREDRIRLKGVYKDGDGKR